MTTKNSIPKSDPSDKSDKSDPSVKSVNTLESLVPPLDLCRKIPFPKFEDSVFVWERKNGWILERTNMDCDKEEDGFYVPAPTLQEILAEFHNFHLEKFGKDNPCSIIVKRDPENFSHYFANHSPVVAALKLWLELNPPEVKP